MKRPSWLCRLFPYLGRRQTSRRSSGSTSSWRGSGSATPASPGDEALPAARRTLGNATLIRERARDVWGWRWLDDLGRDLRHAVRTLRRSPGFTAAVVIILALGTGVATAMFGIVYGMLIRPLPYPDAGRIVRVGQQPRQLPGVPVYLSARAIDQVQQVGAGRARIARQLLTESVLLGVGGGTLGLATAAVVLHATPALVPNVVTRLDEVGLDGVVLAFTLGLSVVVGLLFGAVPALRGPGSICSAPSWRGTRGPPGASGCFAATGRGRCSRRRRWRWPSCCSWGRVCCCAASSASPSSIAATTRPT